MSTDTKPTETAELDRLKALNEELVAAATALVNGYPTVEPPIMATISHRKWERIERLRAALAKARGRT